jgi:uncharacterized protein (TIGR03435 family)
MARKRLRSVLPRRLSTDLLLRSVPGLNRAKKFLLASAGPLAWASALIGLTIGVYNAPVIRAQSPNPGPSQPAPEFDAASIKPWTLSTGGGGSRSGGGLPPPGGGHLQFTPGRVITPLTGVTVKRIIIEAYGLGNYQISGGPEWIDSATFKLEAVSAQSSADENQLRLMLRSLLSKRFHFEMHHDTQEMPVYALTVGRSGPKFKEWKADDQAAARATVEAEWAKGANDVTIEPMRSFVQRMNDDRTNLHPRMTGIDRPVLNKTDLEGTYIFALRLTPEEEYKTTVESQLGLKFQPQKAPVGALIIDRIEKPDPN